jgi:hypothetical protein
MKNKSSVSSPKPHNSKTKFKDNELSEMSDREFRSLMLKMITELKRIQINR